MRWYSRCAGALIAALLTFGVGVVPAGAASSPLWKVQGSGPDLSADGCLQRVKQGIILTSPTSGTTSPNSKHNRCELREQAGDQEAAWNPAQGTHELTTRLAVTKLPTGEPEVVVAQIHGGSDDIVTWRLEGTHLFVKVGDNAQPYATLTESYRVDSRRPTPITLGFTVTDGKIHATANGRTVATLNAPDAPGSYFKTGAYEQSQTRGDGVAQVVLYGEPRALHGGQTATAPRQPRSTESPSCARMPGPLNGRPGAVNTGVPAGAIQKRINGDYTTSSNVSGFWITGTLTVTGNNVSVSCSRVGSMIENKGTGTKVWLTTIGGPGGIGGAAGIRNSDFTARRVEITGTLDGIRTTGPDVDVRDSWIHGLYDDGEAHNDGMQVSAGSSNIVFANNRVNSSKTGSGGYQTSGLILFDKATIVGNYFEGAASTHINALKDGKNSRLSGNVYAKSTRDAVTKGIEAR